MYVSGDSSYPQTSTTPITPAQVLARDTPRARIEGAIDTAAAASRCYAGIESFQGPVSMIDAIQTQTTAATSQVASAASSSATTAATRASGHHLPARVAVPLNPFDFGGAQPVCNSTGGAGMGDYTPTWGEYSPYTCSPGILDKLRTFGSQNPWLVAAAAALALVGLDNLFEGK